MDMETWIWRNGYGDMEFKKKWKTEAQVIFLNSFFVWSSCKWKIAVCPFVDKERTNISYQFANGLNGLNRLAHLCTSPVKHSARL
jgi:hypothetical protein